MAKTRAPIVLAFLLVACSAPPPPADSPPQTVTEARSAPAPPDDAGAALHGWPGTRESPAGRYSWDMGQDRWMHHAHGGTVGVTMTFSASANGIAREGTAVTVGGYSGTFEEPAGGTLRRWTIDIEGKIVSITVGSQPDSTPAQLAEAFAIVDSILYQPTDQGADLLTFTLPAGWDSG